MTTRTITFALPKDLLLKARSLASQRGMSLSGLLVGELERLVADIVEAMAETIQQKVVTYDPHRQRR